MQLKVRYKGFRTITRSRTLPEPTDLAADIGRVARELLDAVDVGDGVRLLGVSVQQLVATSGAVEAGGVRDRGARPARPVLQAPPARSRASTTTRAPIPRAHAALERSVDAVRARSATVPSGPASRVAVWAGPGAVTR